MFSQYQFTASLLPPEAADLIDKISMILSGSSINITVRKLDVVTQLCHLHGRYNQIMVSDI